MSATAPPPDTGTRSTGRLPRPRDPVETAWLALARMALGGTPPVDRITFEADCPACGRPSQWWQERVETRLRTQILCPCVG